MTELGAAVRFTDGVPHRLIVSDARRAMVPIDNADLAAGACTTTSAQLVGGLSVLASTLFRRGRPIGEVDLLTAEPPTQMELRLLTMLSSGIPDGVAAKRLAISERTFRRYVTQLLHKLGAENRFQAGVRAVERGWV
jgi:DNA-binding NarL/FixJ family response regulator